MHYAYTSNESKKKLTKVMISAEQLPSTNHQPHIRNARKCIFTYAFNFAIIPRSSANFQETITKTSFIYGYVTKRFCFLKKKNSL